MKRIVKGSLFLSTMFLSCGFALTPARVASEVTEPAQAARGVRRSSAQALARGREIFLANCARCHGGDGVGKTRLGESVEAPDMTERNWQARRSDRRMRQSVAAGRGQMPAFGGKLSKEEIASAVAYVRALKK